MTDTKELLMKDIQTLFDRMSEDLAVWGSELAFVQLRMSAERFIVPLCGISVERTIRTLRPNQYHVYFEKKLPRFRQGPIDLILTLTSDGGEDDFDNAYCFEFKMVWLNGLQQNISGVRGDIDKLRDYPRGFVVAVLFSFDRRLNWAPYSHEGNIDSLMERITSAIGAPIYEGEAFPISNHEANGELKLVAWTQALH